MSFLVVDGYTMDVIRLGWLDSPVDVDPAVQLKSHTLKDIILYDCSQNYTAGQNQIQIITCVIRCVIHVFTVSVLLSIHVGWGG